MLRKKFLLFKNSLKQTIKNKIQLIGLIILVLLSTTLFSLMRITTNRIIVEYDNLIKKSNLHDFVIDFFQTSYKKKINNNEKNLNCDFNLIECQQQDIVNNISKTNNNNFFWERIETRTFQLPNNGNTKILKLIIYNNISNIDKVVITKKNYNYKKEINNIFFKKIPFFNKIFINKEFAFNNNIKIGSIIRVQPDDLGDSIIVNKSIKEWITKFNTYNWFYVDGYAISADFSTPIIDETTILPNKNREGIIYVHPSQFGLFNNNNEKTNSSIGYWIYDKSKEKLTISSNNDKEIYFIGKFKNKNNKNSIDLISDKLRKYYSSTINIDDKLIYKLFDNSYRFSKRTSLLDTTINGYNLLLTLLLFVVLLISCFTIIMITRKNIDHCKVQIGILKSIGYSKLKILIFFLTLPMTASFVGCILVYIPVSFLQIFIVNIFSQYFNLDFGYFYFDFVTFFYCLLLTSGFLTIITLLVTIIVIKQKPIDLIKSSIYYKISFFGKIIKKFFIKSKFIIRFKLSIFISSIGKMSSVGLTMFLGTILMTMSLIGPKIMSDNKKVSYTGMEYNSSIEYTSPLWNSPYSTYKVYNPNLSSWSYGFDIDRSLYEKEILNDLFLNNINQEFYSFPIDNVINTSSFLTNLTWKQFTKKYLEILENTSIFNNPSFSQIIIKMAWPESTDAFDISNEMLDKDIYFFDNLDSKKNEKKLFDNYDKLRIFYKNYRSTIAMSINKNYLVDFPKFNGKSYLDLDIKKLFDKNSNYNKNFKNIEKLDNFLIENKIKENLFENNNEKNIFYLNKEQDFILNNSIDWKKIAPTNYSEIMKKWIAKFITWYQILFNFRPGQAVVQGVYIKSPYFIKQNISKAFLNKDSSFNVGFNIIPFDKNNDELGTYFKSSFKDKLFKNKSYFFNIYGLKENSKFMKLYDDNNNLLNKNLNNFNINEIPNIVINKTISEQLNLKKGSILKMNIENNELILDNNKVVELSDYDTSDIIKGNIEDENLNYLSNVSLNYGKIKNNKIYYRKNDTNHDYDFYGNYNEWLFNTGFFNDNPTKMQDAIFNNKVNIRKMNKQIKVKIIGIYNGYGEPKAFISKSWADYFTKLIETHKWQYENIFKIEWKNKKIDNFNNFNDIFKKYPRYEDLKNNSFNDEIAKKVLIIFENEYPIFNFKFSKLKNIPDLEKGFSTSNEYSDFTQFSLNGGFLKNKNWNSYGFGSIKKIMPLEASQNVLNQITKLVDIVLLGFAIISLIISFTIILITSNLIIYENIKIISTMKILGYSNSKITNIVIGMYFPILIIMFFSGFFTGIYLIKFILKYLAINTSWVLPFYFYWWLPFIIAFIMFGIYTITFITGLFSIKKINIIY